MNKNKDIILTGDRTTGQLHLGHYVGSLRSRVQLQDEYKTYILLADVQALTTHYDQPGLIADSVHQVTLDYLAVGIDPNKATLFIQSMIPEIAELTVIFSMFITVNSLRHNPTIKNEARDRGYKDLYYGFLGYPVSQAADIAFCKATLVPAGEDQIPHIETARKLVRRFNELYSPVLPEPRILTGERLGGLDGVGKMSKSMGNAISLNAHPDDVYAKLARAKTDPARIHRSDPGHPDICPVFAYHQLFRKDQAAEIHASCSDGTIGCKDCKMIAGTAINELLSPFRERRNYYEQRGHEVKEILVEGTRQARQAARETMLEVREAMGIRYFD
ncbi:tryptophan--tRNA ligase [Paenibacillus marchantiae]|nr:MULTISPECIES: tryptophan--tRNA ligase [Paenibacillus]MCZ1264006.1 tryptophan--tRNA ligase [Paenibacillus tundrae]WDQ34299.1 tryptophan--tRNA ligase [Paenibacillus marchantiae]SDL65299.1 tryptophanyl-tRNA synthetase [Paenibacillus sp. OK060]SHN79084.1 tryptophanyl-tRNA synthetase [Paenibacillus sp. ov031]